MERIIKLFIVFLVFVSCKKPTEQIVDYSKENFGENFESADIDLSKVFDFEWETLYIFPPLTNPDVITKEIGFGYDGGIVPDDNKLFLFTKKNVIVKKFIYENNGIGIGFSDNNKKVYIIEAVKSKYRIIKLDSDDYWLYRE